MLCNICDKREATVFGRWIAWCDDCEVVGKQEDDKKTFDNEIAPDIESGDFSYTFAHGLTDYVQL